MASEQAQPAGGAPPYIFNRDFNSSVRLNYNHWLMKEISGYLLHPKIQFEKENVRIADIGTGTGIWLLELVDKLPSSARLDGFDISAAQYPPQDWIPKNINLTIHDTFKPFADEYLGAYDVVHFRFALCYVNDVDADPLLKNLTTLLKPGGYLQWFEPCPLETQAKATKPSSSNTTVNQLVAMWKKPKPNSSYNWVDGMPSLFEKHGLEEIVTHKMPMKETHRLLWAHSQLLGLQDLTQQSVVKGTAKEAELHKFMNLLQVEFADGVFLDTPYQCVVGRKPL